MLSKGDGLDKQCYLPMLVDYFIGCMHARNLAIVAQIKIMEELLLIFTSHWFDIYVIFQ
jgi:hypothetical protein